MLKSIKSSAIYAHTKPLGDRPYIPLFLDLTPSDIQYLTSNMLRAHKCAKFGICRYISHIMMGATTSIVKGDETERKRGEEFKQIDGSKLKYNLQLHNMRKLSIYKPFLHFFIFNSKIYIMKQELRKIRHQCIYVLAIDIDVSKN